MLWRLRLAELGYELGIGGTGAWMAQNNSWVHFEHRAYDDAINYEEKDEE